MNGWRLEACALVGTLALSASAPAAQPATQDPELDEIVVTARPDSLSSLKLALIDAENRFYERWNELNQDDELDVVCRTEAPTGKRLTVRTCAARALDATSRDQAMRLLAFNDTGGNVKITSTGNLRENVALELRRRTLPLLATDAELRRTLLERVKLQQMHDDLRRKKLQGKFAVWD